MAYTRWPSISSVIGCCSPVVGACGVAAVGRSCSMTMGRRSLRRPDIGAETRPDCRAVLVLVHRPAAQQASAGPFVDEVTEILGAPDLRVVVVVEIGAAVQVRLVAARVELEREVDVVPLALHVVLVEAQAEVVAEHEAGAAAERLRDLAVRAGGRRGEQRAV